MAFNTVLLQDWDECAMCDFPTCAPGSGGCRAVSQGGELYLFASFTPPPPHPSSEITGSLKPNPYLTHLCVPCVRHVTDCKQINKMESNEWIHVGGCLDSRFINS